MRVEPRDSAPENRRFVRCVTLGLALLAIVAIVWEAMTVCLVLLCA
jgi:hypothetical protein